MIPTRGPRNPDTVMMKAIAEMRKLEIIMRRKTMRAKFGRCMTKVRESVEVVVVKASLQSEGEARHQEGSQ